MGLTIDFFGMCAFAKDKASGARNVLMPTMMGHRPVLFINIAFLDMKAANPWKPDVVVYVDDETQFGGWNLAQGMKGLQVTFPNGQSGKSTWVGDNTNLMDLHKYHPGVATFIAGDEASITLPAGTLSTANSGTNNYIVKCPPYADDNRALAKVIRWSSNYAGETLKSPAGTISLVVANVTMTITNVAATPSVGGLNPHFGGYYDLFKPAESWQVTIENKDAQVYDCVPPVDPPDPG